MNFSKVDGIVSDLENRWFKNHVATLTEFKIGDDPAWKIVWAKPDSGTHRIEYLLYQGVLYVTGDLGEAVFVWTDKRNTPLFFRNVCLGYFMEKCAASEVGTEFSDFSTEILLEDFRKHLDNLDESVDEAEGFKEIRDEFAGELSDIKNSQDLANFLNDNLILEDSDWWEYAYGWGKFPHLRCVYIWQGIRMAAKQIYTGEK